jgi:hypothetical protein
MLTVYPNLSSGKKGCEMSDALKTLATDGEEEDVIDQSVIKSESRLLTRVQNQDARHTYLTEAQ